MFMNVKYTNYNVNNEIPGEHSCVCLKIDDYHKITGL